MNDKQKCEKCDSEYFKFSYGEMQWLCAECEEPFDDVEEIWSP